MSLKLLKRPLGLFLLLFFMMSPAMAVRDSVKFLAIQNGGRLKPFDTFAKESLQLLHGKRSLEGRSAIDVIMTMYMVPDLWENTKFISIKNLDLKRELKFEEGQNLFSMKDILSSTRLRLIIEKLRSREAMKEKLNPYYQAIQKIEGQIFTYQSIVSGQALTLVPPKQGESSQWLPVFHSTGPFVDLFSKIGSEFAMSVGAEVKDRKPELDTLKKTPAQAEIDLAQTVSDFSAAARAQNPELYPKDRDIKIEVFYNSLQPFMWSWICYLVAGFMFLMFLLSHRKWTKNTAFFFLFAGFLIHTLGFAFRIYISGRPPVSNMYETVIWVAYGAILFGFIIERIYRHTVVLIGSCLVAMLCLILADLAPAILDPSLQPLEPVLVSNFWLIIHVMTISISYAAFFLALALGNIGLFFYIRNEEKNKTSINQVTNAIYRCIQIGVVLLAAGIILGGIWADYSWGRFWGWDPKETWALIALLGYLAMLHGRLGGWIKNFGMNVWAVVAFSLVIMAWYGVNFVLGAGLHSYGFGAGGIEYVVGFIVAEIIYVVYAWMMRGKA